MLCAALPVYGSNIHDDCVDIFVTCACADTSRAWHRKAWLQERYMHDVSSCMINLTLPCLEWEQQHHLSVSINQRLVSRSPPWHSMIISPMQQPAHFFVARARLPIFVAIVRRDCSLHHVSCSSRITLHISFLTIIDHGRQHFGATRGKVTVCI